MALPPKFDSEAFYQRLLKFGIDCQELVLSLPKTQYNFEYGGQLIRSSGSTGANYLEALEATSRKDFLYRLRITRKEIRESIHWLRLIQNANKNNRNISGECQRLINEGNELKQILSSSILTTEQKSKLSNS